MRKGVIKEKSGFIEFLESYIDDTTKYNLLLTFISPGTIASFTHNGQHHLPYLQNHYQNLKVSKQS